MGWTHYWERETELPQEAFEKAVKDCRVLLAAVDVPLAGSHAEGEPVFRGDGIVFNGIKGHDCEPFSIKLVEVSRRPGKLVFSYCKTQKLPYDLCVKCTLIILKHHLGDKIRVMSDFTDEDWNDARNLCQGCLGYGLDFELPKE